jgi:hypothetical protein
MNYYQKNNPKRHRLIRTFDAMDPRPEVPKIENIEELHLLLQEAIRLEHFTIPPYLCALYSIKEGTYDEKELANPKNPVSIIRSVVMEEMLHMIMAANILNAVGGEPRIKAEDFVPSYPSQMPHSAIDFEVGLLRFSKEAINTFLRIERPADPHVQPAPGKFRSIGEFYASLRAAIIDLDREAKAKGKKNGIFTGTKKQVTGQYYFGGGGKLIPVCSLEDALLVIDEIAGQGEGIDGTIVGDNDMFGPEVEIAHYFLFNEIFNERRYVLGDKPNEAPSGSALFVNWDSVYNMLPNPKMSTFQNDTAILQKIEKFNETYMKLLDNIDQACNGYPEALKDGIPLMYALRDLAVALMKCPTNDGNYTAGPTFELVARKP